MLNQLIESRSGAAENKTRGGLMLTTFVLVLSFCLSAVTYSLFAKELGTGTGALELSTLVAPIADNAPPAPIEKQEKPEPSRQTKSELPTRQANILRIEESPLPPKEISTVPNTQKSRPTGNFLVSDKLETNGSPGSPFGNPNAESGSGINVGDSGDAEPAGGNLVKSEPPPAPTKKAVAEKPKTPAVTSGGVVNGKAKFLPKPIYTAAAKAVKAAGDVNVQVLIDEAGNVVSAKAAGGHPLLKIEAEKAARSAKFNPTLLSNQPVKVSGIIVYKFSM